MPKSKLLNRASLLFIGLAIGTVLGQILITIFGEVAIFVYLPILAIAYWLGEGSEREKIKEKHNA